MSETKRISISTAQAEYLTRLRNSDAAFAELLRGTASIFMQENSVLLTKEGAETLRSFFTIKLAEVGFDEHYAVNIEGRMLEALIDNFFMPSSE